LIPSKFIEFLVATILIILAPGPSVLFTIAQAISWGKRIAVITVIGNALGMFLISIFVAVGLGPLLQSSKLFFDAVQWAGGGYLIYLGIRAISKSKVHADEMLNELGSRPSSLKTLKDGFWVGVLNPKSVVFFAAILPQFIDRDSNNIVQQLIFLGLIFCVIAIISDGSYGILAGTVRSWLSGKSSRLVTMRRIGGTVMIGLGIFTIFSAAILSASN
jgi:threonine/homoserine/homoserine lactone efflux protein